MEGINGIRVAILTASDTRSIEDDASGQRLRELLEKVGADVVEHLIVSDDKDEIRSVLLTLVDDMQADLILTTGGTGLGPRDNTPEATQQVIDREAPGIAESMRFSTAAKTPSAVLSRGIAGTRDRTLIINLPGSPKAVEECFSVIYPILGHALRMVRGDTEH